MLIDHIVLNLEVKNQEELFEYIANTWEEKGVVTNALEFKTALEKRESESSTAFVDGFAIPHGKSSCVNNPGIMFIKLATPLNLESMDGKVSDCIFSLAITDIDGGDEHLRNLALISRKLVDAKFRDSLKNANDINAIIEIIKEI